jgi:transcription antitermination factor NusG
MSSPVVVEKWYAVQVRPRAEKQVAAALVAKGYENFLPLYRRRSRWSDRIKVVELPLFDGYLFCKMDVTKRLPLLKTPNVIGVVGIAKNPVPVDEKEIKDIFALVLAEAGAEPCPYLHVGQRVRIDRGALSGVEGILVAQSKPARLVVSVTLLQRSVSVEIDETLARPVESVSAPVFRPQPAPGAGLGRGKGAPAERKKVSGGPDCDRL